MSGFWSIPKPSFKLLTRSTYFSKNELYNWLREVLPEFDEDRVYESDIKKLVQWYNVLHTAGLVELKKIEDGIKNS